MNSSGMMRLGMSLRLRRGTTATKEGVRLGDQKAGQEILGMMRVF
jgi:hypothetical protein